MASVARMTYRPRILAVENVQLFIPREIVEALDIFYADRIGLERYRKLNGDNTLEYRGRPRSGPRLVLNVLPPEATAPVSRPPLLIEMANIMEFVERIEQEKMEYTWVRGWSFFDRKLVVYDPAGHRVELGTSHPF